MKSFILISAAPASSNSSFVDFYNHVMTFSESKVHLVCCKLDRTPVTATCGQGFSCAAACHSKEAVLCPSHNCENCDDMEGLVQVEAQRKRGGHSRGGNCPACSFSADLNNCKSDGCKVLKKYGGDPKCCFHPDCRDARPRKCSWFKNLMGECKSRCLFELVRCLMSSVALNPHSVLLF